MRSLTSDARMMLGLVAFGWRHRIDRSRSASYHRLGTSCPIARLALILGKKQLTRQQKSVALTKGMPTHQQSCRAASAHFRPIGEPLSQVMEVSSVHHCDAPPATACRLPPIAQPRAVLRVSERPEHSTDSACPDLAGYALPCLSHCRVLRQNTQRECRVGTCRVINFDGESNRSFVPQAKNHSCDSPNRRRRSQAI
jgi:hypothetical protein